MATRDRWLLVEDNDDLGSSSAKVRKCAAGSFPARVFAGNFLASMINWWRRTTRIRRASWWSGD